MKRSEFKKERLELHSKTTGTTLDILSVPLFAEARSEADCKVAEAAGVVWDPEDPPKPKLPARLVASLTGERFLWEDEEGVSALDLTMCDCDDDSPDCGMSPREVAILEEAVRRYNLLPAIRQRIEEHLDNPPMYGCAMFCEQLVRWIDGTEQPPEAQDER